MANRGQKIEILDNNGNMLYPKTSGDNVVFGNNGETVGGKLGDALTDIGNLKTTVSSHDDEIREARNTPTENYPTLRLRLDAIEDNIGEAVSEITNTQNAIDDVEAELANAKNKINNLELECGHTRREVENSRGGEGDLNSRLDKMQDAINGLVGGGGGGGTSTVDKEVEDARTSTGGTQHGSLKDRLNYDFGLLEQGLMGIQAEITKASTDVNGVQSPSLSERLNEDFNYLDEKFDNYLPLTGGDVDTLTIGGNEVWHQGNFNPADKRDNLRPSTVNWYTGTPIILDDGRMSIGKAIDFHNTKDSIYTYDVRLIGNGNNVQSTGGLVAATNVQALGNYYVANNQGVLFANSQGTYEFGVTNFSNDTLQFGVTGRQTRLVGSEVFVQNAILTSNFGQRIGGWFSGESATEYRREYGTAGKFATKQFATVQNIDITNSNVAPCHTIEVLKYDDTGTTPTINAQYFFEQGGFYPSNTQSGIANLGYSLRSWKGVYCTDGVQQSSDMARKHDIRDIDDTIFYNLLKNTGVHSYVLKYDGMTDDIVQETAPQTQLHIGVVAQDMEQYDGAEYILNKYPIDENGTEEFFLNNYNYSSAIHAGLKVLIGKHEMLEYEVKQLKTKLNSETTRRKELEQIIEDLTA